ncbi:CLUMA_CG015575, isoform A [Clunio marinus]|uniref:CLUMA_CG015575, isoform A n=1 Tax=Clunio marinus TaxID=568069 RepID=A0A1J1INX2_9DIPT|nr:CLUMA_CG015575, isoform A [Clunio marinus]
MAHKLNTTPRCQTTNNSKNSRSLLVNKPMEIEVFFLCFGQKCGKSFVLLKCCQHIRQKHD